MPTKRGQLILIEGLDRSGKSTQSSILHETISNSKLIKFPDRSTKIGGIINEYLTDHSFELSDQSAHLLFSANRWELAETIVKDLNDGKFIIMDRYIYSGLAYSLAKSQTSDISPEMADLQWLYSPDKGLPMPDLTIFLTLDLEELSNRKGWGDERYEKQEFQKVVKLCFMKVLDDKDPSITTIDVNNKDISQVSKLIWHTIEEKGVNKLTEVPIRKFN